MKGSASGSGTDCLRDSPSAYTHMARLFCSGQVLLVYPQAGRGQRPAGTRRNLSLKIRAATFHLITSIHGRPSHEVVGRSKMARNVPGPKLSVNMRVPDGERLTDQSGEESDQSVSVRPCPTTLTSTYMAYNQFSKGI